MLPLLLIRFFNMLPHKSYVRPFDLWEILKVWFPHSKGLSSGKMHISIGVFIVKVHSVVNIQISRLSMIRSIMKHTPVSLNAHAGYWVLYVHIYFNSPRAHCSGPYFTFAVDKYLSRREDPMLEFIPWGIPFNWGLCHDYLYTVY